MSIDLPLVLDGADARAIAQRELWRAQAERSTAELTLPPSYMHVEEGDALVFVLDGETYTVIVTEAEIGVNRLVSVKGFVEVNSTLSYIGPAGSGWGATGLSGYVPPSMLLNLVDVAPLKDAHTDTPGLYYGQCAHDPLAQWAGAALYESSDGGTNYTQRSFVAAETTMGRATTVLASGPTSHWDMVNTVDIELFHGSLSSITQARVLNERINFALLGGEVIAFANATLQADGTYRLSTMIRGARATEDQVGTHALLEPFVLLDGVNFLTREVAEFLADRDFKSVSTGATVADAFNIDHVCQLATIRCFPPTHPKHKHFTTGDLDLVWTRRTRGITNPFSGAGGQLLEPSEDYDVVITDDPPVAGVSYTERVIGASSTSITAATLSGAGLTATGALDVTIYQISHRIGRGKSLTFKVPASP